MKNFFFFLIIYTVTIACNSNTKKNSNKLQPVVITERVMYDTDDPAIWIHPNDSSKSLIVGTDKNENGGLYLFDLQGKIVDKVTMIKRPNNVDIIYQFSVNGVKKDIAVLTERETNKIKFFELPTLKEIGTGIEVFAKENLQAPMGIATYKNPQKNKQYVIVSRKFGNSGTYLWQYELTDNKGILEANVVRKFGNFNGGKEIESIAVDEELGFIYYSDEGYGIHKYFADPEKGNSEIAVFGTKDFKEDVEGISIYKKDKKTGYILVSNQQANTFNIYAREGTKENPNQHIKIAEITMSTIESDGSDVSAVNFGVQFPKGLFVAMSNGRVFHYYDWQHIQERIDSSLGK